MSEDATRSQAGSRAATTGFIPTGRALRRLGHYMEVLEHMARFAVALETAIYMGRVTLPPDLQDMLIAALHGEDDDA